MEATFGTDSSPLGEDTGAGTEAAAVSWAKVFGY